MFRLSSLVVIVWLGIASSILIAEAAPFAPFGSHYGLIEQHMEKEPHDTDVVLKEARGWLRQLESESSLMQRGLLKSLRQFLSLGSFTHGISCDLNSYEIVKTNNEASDNLARLPSYNSDEATPLVYTIHELSKLHANECLPKYLSNLEAELKYPELKESVDMVSFFVKALQDHYNDGNKYFMIGEESASVLVEALSKKAQQDIASPCFKSWSRGCSTKLTRVINSYLIKPCQELVGIAQYIFEPYQYDRQMQPVFDGPTESLELFKKTSTYYTHCSLMLQAKSRFIEDLIKVAKK